MFSKIRNSIYQFDQIYVGNIEQQHLHPTINPRITVQPFSVLETHTNGSTSVRQCPCRLCILSVDEPGGNTNSSFPSVFAGSPSALCRVSTWSLVLNPQTTPSRQYIATACSPFNRTTAARGDTATRAFCPLLKSHRHQSAPFPFEVSKPEAELHRPALGWYNPTSRAPW